MRVCMVGQMFFSIRLILAVLIPPIPILATKRIRKRIPYMVKWAFLVNSVFQTGSKWQMKPECCEVLLRYSPWKDDFLHSLDRHVEMSKAVCIVVRSCSASTEAQIPMCFVKKVFAAPRLGSGVLSGLSRLIKTELFQRVSTLAQCSGLSTPSLIIDW